MTEQPEPTQAIDMTKVLAEAREDAEARKADAVEGEPGWEGDGTPAGGATPTA